ncbi:PfkB domain-containing protein [Bifidobacterium sp. DSM 109958]|uniref:Ribokinase n=1 Tax=Bifidobacterium moraviense TaxID=2675323 RepID=A0A7Y0F1P5_9BIFI|nr:ribokinase [Bifidobacterium sp. DSM 109958]NMN00363.1 PfkB domain-containing protein [Bifidobacterium sp. DSM 109958]
MSETVLDQLQSLSSASGTVAIVGSMNADYTVVTDRLPAPGETIEGGPLRILPGGKSANQASSAALLGAKVRMFGAVGSDSNADFLLGHLSRAGVDTGEVLRVPGASGTTVITVDAHGENTIVYSPGSNGLVDAAYVEGHRRAIEEASVLGLCLESPMDAVIAAARAAHGAGVPVLLNDSPFVADLPEELVALADILLVNEHEAAELLSVPSLAGFAETGPDWDDVAARMARLGFSRAVITLGGEGSMVLDGDVRHRVAPVRVDAKDTTGCGDAFMGTILAGLAAGFTLAQSARMGSYVSAYAATGYGAQASYGTAAQIAERFAADDGTTSPTR